MPTHVSSNIMCPFREILLELGSFLLETGRPVNQHKVLSIEVTTELLENMEIDYNETQATCMSMKGSPIVQPLQALNAIYSMTIFKMESCVTQRCTKCVEDLVPSAVHCGPLITHLCQHRT